MRKILAVILMLGLACAYAEDQKPEAKKAEKAKSSAKKKEQKPQASGKSDQNFAQKAESDLGRWARKNKVWGTPRPGD